MGKLAKDAADGISGSKVNAFVGMRSDELAAAAAAYEEAIKAAGLDAVASADQTKTSALAAHKRQVRMRAALFVHHFFAQLHFTVAPDIDGSWPR